MLFFVGFWVFWFWRKTAAAKGERKLCGLKKGECFVEIRIAIVNGNFAKFLFLQS